MTTKGDRSSDDRRPPVRVSFVAASSGDWHIDRVVTVRGQGLPAATALTRTEAGLSTDLTIDSVWVLNGVRSNERYSERAEKQRLGALQEGLGRPTSRAGALIPIQKSDAWWDLPQDERRAVFEAQSQHIAIGVKYLPAIARQLYHCRDLDEPFDFLTWFEFDPADAAAFDDLLGQLRATEEWRYVVREAEIRVSRVV